MKIAEYKQIDTKTIENAISVIDYNEEGEEIGQHEEIVRKEIPVMGMVYRDMTSEEEAEMLRQQKELEEYERNRPLTAEERMEILEDAFAELCEEVFA